MTAEDRGATRKWPNMIRESGGWYLGRGERVMTAEDRGATGKLLVMIKERGFSAEGVFL
jgi:uncharacterized protein (DUF1330 family)